MEFHCITICSNCIIIRRIEFSFLSQQSVMSVCKTFGFLSPNRIAELVWDSKSEKDEASNNSTIYLGNRILCIFLRQPLKYLCFSYSLLDGVRKYHVEILDSPS
jgi:hypothetical protein